MSDVFTVLRTPPPTVTQSMAARLLRDHYGIEGTLTLQDSERDQNFRVSPASGESCVLKIANSAEAADVTEFQTAALLHLQGVNPGVPVPRVIRTITGDTQTTIQDRDGRLHNARVLSWLEGVPVRHAHGKPDVVVQLGTALAQLGVALQGFTHPASEYALLWDIKRAGSLIELLVNIEDAALQRACQQRLHNFVEHTEPALKKLRSQVIHNDLNLSNVLIDPEHTGVVTGIIDFGDMVKSPLIVDVAVAAAYLFENSSAPLASIVKFLSGYTRIRPLQREELELLQELILIRNVTTIVIGNWRASQYPDNRGYLLRSEPQACKTIDTLTSMDRSEVADIFGKACGL